MKANQKYLRFISFILAVIMTVTSVNVAAFADEMEDYNIEKNDTAGNFNEDENIYGASGGTITVTISVNGGDELKVEDRSIQATLGENYGQSRGNELPFPSREGYFFSGWYTDPEDGKGEVITADTKVTKSEPHTIYAQWTLMEGTRTPAGGVGGQCGPGAYWELDVHGVFKITGSGDTYNIYTASDGDYPPPWEKYKKRIIRSIEINNDITSIGNNFFSGCTALNGEIELKRVKKIEHYAFYGCNNITSIKTNENDLISIGNYAFSGCSNLESIATGPNLNKIGEGAFLNCKKLARIKLGNDMTTISERAFKGCNALKVDSIPSSVKNILSEAFEGCNNLGDIKIPEGVETIANNAFNNSPNEIKATITAIPETAGEDFVNNKVNAGELKNYYIEAKVVPTSSVFEFVFDGSPINILKDPETGEDLFHIANKNKYNINDIVYSFYGDSIRDYNEMRGNGDILMIDNEGELQVKVEIKKNGHYLGTDPDPKKSIVAKIKISYKNKKTFTVSFDTKGGANVGTNSSIEVRPYHVIGYTPTSPRKRYEDKYEDKFLGWYDESVTPPKKWDFKRDKVTGDMALVAHWETDPLYIADQKAREEARKQYEEELKKAKDKLIFGEYTVEGIGKTRKEEYTGKQIKFSDIVVYHGDKLLVKGKDYTVKYENNINVGTDARVYIIGKGNYTDKIEIPFEITPVDILRKKTEGKLIVDDVIYCKYTGSRVEGKPTVKLEKDGKIITLKYGRDYECEYEDSNFTKFIEPNDPNDPENTTDQYTIYVKGIGNYKNSVSLRQIITTATIISDYRFKAIYDKDGNPSAEVAVKYINNEGKTAYRNLTKDKDFIIEDDPDNSVITVKGIGKYSGIKKLNYGKPIKKNARIVIKTPKAALFYTGKEVRPEIVLYDKKDSKTPLVGCLASEKVAGVRYDYTYEYVDNVKAGKAKIIVKGRGKYRDIASKTFVIAPFNFTKNVVRNKREIKVAEIPSQTMIKGGVRPKVVVKDITYTSDGNGNVSANEILLAEGRDYKLTYSNNKKKGVATAGTKAPTVNIKGIGNYKSVFKKPFTITQSDLSELDGSLIMVSDIVWKDKANICKPIVTVKDSDGKNLTAGKDYEKVTSFTYVDACNVKQKGVEGEVKRKKGDKVNALDIIPANTRIEAVIKAKSAGNYKGTVKKEFRIIEEANDISKASATVNNTMEFTGDSITLDVSDITVILNGNQLNNSKPKLADFEIVGYANNINVGKATVYIRGKEGKDKIPYGGTKKVTFTITPKRIGE